MSGLMTVHTAVTGVSPLIAVSGGTVCHRETGIWAFQVPVILQCMSGLMTVHTAVTGVSPLGDVMEAQEVTHSYYHRCISTG